MEEEILQGVEEQIFREVNATELGKRICASSQSQRDRLEQGRRIGVATAQSFAALPIGQLDDLAKKHTDAKARFDAANAELRAHFEHVAEDLVSAYQREIESLEVDSNELEQLLVTIAQRRAPPAPEPRNGKPKQRKPEEISTDDTPKDAAE